MLSRQFVRAAAVAPQSGLRALSTSAMRQSKTPSMGDVNPSRATVEAFNQKQIAFREQQIQAQKNREASAFTSPPKSADAASKQPTQGSQDANAGRSAEAKQPEPDRKAGPLTNLIYGTKEGRELEAQLEASFSQVLARGKYVHSIVFHEVKPDKVDEYVKLVGDWYPKMANTPENKVHLVGSWRTEVGDCDTFGMFPCSPVRLVLCFPFDVNIRNTIADLRRGNSSYLGVSEVRRLPRVATQHLKPPRIRRVR